MTAHATDPHLSPSEELDRLIDAGRLPSAGLMDQALRNAANEGGHLDATVVGALCQHLEESAQLIADHPLTQGGIDRTDAFRYLLSLTAFAIDWGILSGDPFAPMFSPAYPAHRLDWGAANPDGVYRKVLVRDDCAYLIGGRMGNARYFSLDFRPSSHNETVTPADLNPDPEGRFEMYVGGREQGRWWPMQAGTHAIVTREFFDNWSGARKAQLRIDRIDGPDRPNRGDESDRIAAAFEVIGRWILEGGVRYWLEHSTDMLKRSENAFLGEFRRGETKLPVVCPGAWHLAPDEALLIELPDPQATYWGLQVASSLVHTLDYSKALTSFNNAQAHRDPDGTYRLVLAHEDPGVYNWLDTGGLHYGTLFLRFYEAMSPSAPRTTLTKFADLHQVVHAERLSTEERRVQIGERREGVARLLCD
ncbi:MAG: DUF1214 domain-containing protein [Acidimicrobiales bacterium]